MAIHSIKNLQKVASKPSRLIIGLMSGTSLDGLDVALCKITGHGTATRVKLLHFITVPYPASVKQRILKVFAKEWVSFHDVVELHPWVAQLQAKYVLQCLKKWGYNPGQIDCIASHGQTIFHAPKFLFKGSKLNATFQAGDGDHLAVATGILTLSDFRQKHLAAGGEGAPLAVYGDYLLFAKKGVDRILLNLGGIANFTYLPSTAKPSAVFVTDTGPGNTLLDQQVRQQKPSENFDKDARYALHGKVNDRLLTALKQHAFFKRSFPKTIGPELFNTAYVDQAKARAGVSDLSFYDTLATLTQLSADTAAAAIRKTMKGKPHYEVIVSGGGAHNPLLLHKIKEQLPAARFYTLDKLGLSGDAKEAVLFAILANETLCDSHLNFGNRMRIPSVTLGKISLPT